MPVQHAKISAAIRETMLYHRELSFLVLGTGVEEVLEGCQIYLPCFIGLPNLLANS